MKEAVFLAQQINQFYLEAFNHALVVVGIVFGLVGVIVPAGIAIFQARQAKAELNQLKSQISTEVVTAVAAEIANEKEAMQKEQASSLEAFQQRSDKVVSDLRSELARHMAASRASAFHVQAVSALNSNLAFDAVSSAVQAIPNYVQGRDFDNLRRVCSGIAVSEFAKLSMADAGRQKDDFVKNCEYAVESMAGVNENGGIGDLISDLKSELADFLKRN